MGVIGVRISVWGECFVGPNVITTDECCLKALGGVTAVCSFWLRLKKETVSLILAAQSLKKWVGKDGFEPPKA